MLPVSTLLTGQYGIADVCSQPAVHFLAQGGVERILSPALTPSETAALNASARALQQVLAHMDLAI